MVQGPGCDAIVNICALAKEAKRKRKKRKVN